jgi:hypothetical protein
MTRAEVVLRNLSREAQAVAAEPEGPAPPAFSIRTPEPTLDHVRSRIMSLFPTVAKFPSSRRPGGRGHRPHPEALERRAVLSTLAGHATLPIAAAATPASTAHAAGSEVAEVASTGASPQQPFGPNTVRIQNLLRFPRKRPGIV